MSAKKLLAGIILSVCPLAVQAQAFVDVIQQFYTDAKANYKLYTHAGLEAGVYRVRFDDLGASNWEAAWGLGLGAQIEIPNMPKHHVAVETKLLYDSIKPEDNPFGSNVTLIGINSLYQYRLPYVYSINSFVGAGLGLKYGYYSNLHTTEWGFLDEHLDNRHKFETPAVVGAEARYQINQLISARANTYFEWNFMDGTSQWAIGLGVTL